MQHLLGDNIKTLAKFSLSFSVVFLYVTNKWGHIDRKTFYCLGAFRTERTNLGEAIIVLYANLEEF